MPTHKSIQEPSVEPIGQGPAAAKGAPAAASAAVAITADSPATTPDTAATRALTAALVANPGSTVEELYRATKISHSTARKAPLALEKAGKASRHLGAIKGSKLMPDRWQAGPLTKQSEAVEPAEPASGAAAVDGAAELLAGAEGQEPEPIPAADSAASVVGKDTGEPPVEEAARGKARLGAGRLREMVLDHFRDHPQEELTPFMLGRRLGHSSGAVANAAEKLAADGAIVQTSQKPRRYRLAA